VGSDVLTSAQQNFTSLHEEIERLHVENTSEDFFSNLAKELTQKQLQEYVTLSKRVATRLFASQNDSAVRALVRKL